MARGIVVVLLLLGLVACDGSSPEAPPTPDEGEGGGPSVGESLVGTWDYGMRYRSGDVVAMVRVFEGDGTGSQYTRDAGPETAQTFRWTVGEDGGTVTLVFGGATTVVYDIEERSDRTLTLKARTARESFPEVCTKR